MKLNNLWDWEKNKLAANIDLRQSHLEEGALPPGAGHRPLQKATRKGGMSVTENNIHKLHLTPIHKVPFQRQLDRKLTAVQEPSRRQPASAMPNFSVKRKPRRHKLTSITAPKAEKPIDDGLDDTGPVTLGKAEYVGDLFGSRGDYSNSMLYRSRMDGNKEVTHLEFITSLQSQLYT